MKDQAQLGGTQISMPLIEGLSEKLDFEVDRVSNFTIMPLDSHVVFAWNEHADDGTHPLLMEVLDYDEFNDIADSAIQAITASGLVTNDMVDAAMEHVEILEELGASMYEYPMIGAYLNKYFPGFLEFPEENVRSVLTEALAKVREGWEG